MRRSVQLAAALSLALAASPGGGSAATQDANLPPHAWLFGTWTGGIFPVSSSLPPQTCLSQPVVIFTRDLVMRATLTEQTLTQREIQTARAIPGGMEFRLTSTGAAPGALVRGTRGGGFGCASPDVLTVQRRGDNEITFPGCADFPNTLVRCQTR